MTPAEKFCYLVREIREKGQIFVTFATQTMQSQLQRNSATLPVKYAKKAGFS